MPAAGAGGTMSTVLTIALGQHDYVVGDVDGNAGRILAAAREAHARGAHLLMVPELALSGYPPEDLLFHRGFRRQIDRALARLCTEGPGIDLLVGHPEYVGRDIYNSASLIQGGRVSARYHKQVLPNYRVFDEKRYFRAGTSSTVVTLRGVRVGLLICEDVWEPEPALAARAAGAELLLVVNASPFNLHKQREREAVAADRIREVALPIVYLNLIGGQDELVFDGNSFIMDANGEVSQRLAPWRDGLELAAFERAAGAVVPVRAPVAPELTVEASAYEALVRGVRDYVSKHRFPGVVMGLSGGVDSALTLAIAVDALGPDRVRGVMMPSRYTSAMSLEDAAEQARLQGVRYTTISIEGMFEATLAALREEFQGRAPDTTEENIQSRCRGVLLMAISNKTGAMLLTTGNKSEMAVGYATLYGDMAGGFAPIKDVSKLLVYRLARYRNARGQVIPERVLTRPPSAELAPGQKDTDTLPPYEVLDPILEAFIEEDLSVDEIAARGFDRATVGRVLDMVKRNEYKRRQAPPGVRISPRAFGRDWRYPITSGYRPG